MRKQNIFGKKINYSKPLYLIIIVFAISIFGYFLVTYLNGIQLAKLKEEQATIQVNINSLLILNNETNYQEIDELIPFLPNSFNEAILYNELELIKNLSDITDPSVYVIHFDAQADSPFENDVDDNLQFVKISINMSIDDYNKIFDYIDNLNDSDRLYYIDSLNLSILSEDSASVAIVIYTYYMN
jgi:hypothetical protein